ncbi:hypothetical protein A2Y99_01720, partial [Candidatus Gottesmanbacteria bacterium RBG_13_37_7]
MSFYNQSIHSVEKKLATNIETGLTQKEARIRLRKHGPNLLPTPAKPPLILKFFNQFKDVLILILLIATAISLLLGEMIDAVAIATIVVINAVIGFVQEVKAQQTLESLKQKEVTYALVLRGGSVEKIPTSEVVPGDILILEEGAKVASDGRIVESFSLRTDESSLTGESIPVAKNTEALNQDTILADRINMVFKDTQIMTGRGKAIVTATGKETEMGQIAQTLGEEKKEKTPLTLEIEHVGQTLTIIIGVIAIIVFVLNFMNRVPLIDSLLVSISLAVAAIPEGLPAIVTIVLSIGVKRLADKKTIVKKLPAVETLGSVRIIATDKTGTLTQNKINVTKIILAGGEEFTIEGEGYEPTGVFFNRLKKIVNPTQNMKIEQFLKAGILASNASYHPQTREIIGDTTEGALLVAAHRANINSEEIRHVDQTLYEIPFSSERKMMSKLIEVNRTGDHILFVKGAPEVIAAKCRLSLEAKKQLLSLTQELAKAGLRSLALAQKSLTNNEVKGALEKDILAEDSLTYLGIAGMQDPLRPEVTEALNEARNAGIRSIMITGDHKETALTIARQAGITTTSLQVLTETEVEKLSITALAKKITEGVSVFARISPLGKLKLIKAIKTIPDTKVAVTGDGVNDAPALSASHIGVAMGMTGTDITREVADIVIMDDNYATIVDAVREGRTIYANLVKFIRYLISCNLSEVIVVSSGVFFGVPIPLLPIQILFVNLITDGLPALALGMDPPEFDVMKKPPRHRTDGLLHKKRWIYMMIEGSLMGIFVFALFLFALANLNYQVAQTMAFTSLAFSQLTHAYNNRSTRRSIFQLGILSNKYLVYATLVSVSLQLFVVQSR